MTLEEIGLRIRNLRTDRCMTVDALARRAGLSKSYLSKIERGLKTPPISTLSNVARALGVEIAHLFQSGADRPKITHTKAETRTKVNSIGATFGYFYESLADSFRDKAMEPFIIVMTPNAEEHVLFSHAGQELFFVLEGRVLFYYGKDRYVCEPGDCLYLDASEEHRGECLGQEEAKALVVIVPEPKPESQKVLAVNERLARGRSQAAKKSKLSVEETNGSREGAE